ncbi:MAG: HD-GYP domain-containing protein [Solirubrobacteraceae bacterium]
MVVRSESELTLEIERLRAESAQLRAESAQLYDALERRACEAAEKELQLERYAADLRETFKQERMRSQELQRSYMATVRALSNAVEARDAYTGKHAERVAAYGMEIAHSLDSSLAVAPEIEFGFLLHDIGKVAIPDAILYKPGRLTDEERALMARHPVIGAEIVRGIEFLAEAADVVRSHHERWDGRGYPDGLSREGIPLAARVFSVADVLDALTTDRPYRPATSLQDARAMIVSESGSHFDPRVIEAMQTIPDATFARIAAAMANPPGSRYLVP